VKIPLIIFLIVLFQTNLFSQSGSLDLIVVDQSSSAISNVTAQLAEDENIIKEISISTPQNIIFSNIKSGVYTLKINAPGFSEFFEEIEIKNETVTKIVQIDVAQIIENVTVESSSRDKNLDPREGAFTNFLTVAEIESLPENPEQLLKALKRQR